ncbi:MAG: GDSL-type esterase/lipase family protein [Acidobacteriota bacterium]
MSRWARAAVVAVCGVLAAVSCSAPPTAPTPIASDLAQSAIAQTPPPVPPRIAAPQPMALGATRFLAIGDSITYGTLSSYDGSFLYDVPSHSYTVRLQSALTTYYPRQTFTVTNVGVPGEWAQVGAQRLHAELTRYRPQALLILEGINDLNADQSISVIGRALRDMLDIAALFDTPVLIATMFQTYEVTTPTGQVRTNAASSVPALNAEIRRIAEGRRNVWVVDLHAAFGTNRSLVGGDGLHPSTSGYERMATTFLTAIETAFPVRGSFQ